MMEMGWQVDEEVNRDKTGETDRMNLEVDSKDEIIYPPEDGHPSRH